MKHAAMVESLGYSTLAADNGMQGIETLTREKVDLIIADLNMPVMDGYDFVREVRNLPEFAGTPIIVASTEAGEEDIRRAYLAGADLYLVKPVDAETIKARIELLLEKKP
ncbi:MAG: response regulator [Proteobacteria bacterium]|nr:response regulator [Pseudomonadota bacterium]